MKRLTLLVIVLVALVTGAAGATISDGTDVNITAQNDLNLGPAQHVRIMGRDGNFEFESGNDRSLLLAYRIGSATRLPIVIGGNNGAAQPNFVGLQLDANAGQSVDVLQVRDSVGTVVAGVRPSGDVRAPSVTLSGIKLTLAYQGSTLCLVATLPDGTTRRVALR